MVDLDACAIEAKRIAVETADSMHADSTSYKWKCCFWNTYIYQYHIMTQPRG